MAISYVVDIYRGVLKPARAIDTAVYLSFFPHLVAGPIVRGTELLPQIRRRRDERHVDYVEACWLILRRPGQEGGALLLPGHLRGRPGVRRSRSSTRPSRSCSPSTATPSRSTPTSAATPTSPSASPCCSGSSSRRTSAGPTPPSRLQDFWRRWHITLSFWLRDYLYIPLGGNRGSEWRISVNILITMLLGGLWHGAAWTFVAWGLYHGVGQVIGRQRRRGAGRPWPAPRTGRTGPGGAGPVRDLPVGLPRLAVVPGRHPGDGVGHARVGCSSGGGRRRWSPRWPSRHRRRASPASTCPTTGSTGSRSSSPTAARWCRGAYWAWCFWPSPPSGPRAWPPSSTTGSDRGPDIDHPPTAGAGRSPTTGRPVDGPVDVAAPTDRWRRCRRAPTGRSGTAPTGPCRWARQLPGHPLDPDAVHRGGLLRRLAAARRAQPPALGLELPARAPAGRSPSTWSARSPR